MTARRSLLLAGLAVPFARTAMALDGAPAPMLAGTWRPGMPLDDYWVSEKYDGVRCLWDGRQLLSRSGAHMPAPAWFTALLPKVALDGELWAGRGRYAQVMATLRSSSPNDTAWHELRFMVFDLPAQAGDFSARLAVLRKLLPITDAPWVVPVPQQRATSPQELQGLLDKTVKMGGEGLMLHRGASPYRAGRSSTDLLKFKPFEDADARVLAQVPGKGRRAHRLAALLVETPEGRRFRLDNGFTEAQRAAPPPVGSWVTYTFDGSDAAGQPKAPRFLREREDGPA